MTLEGLYRAPPALKNEAVLETDGLGTNPLARPVKPGSGQKQRRPCLLELCLQVLLDPEQIDFYAGTFRTGPCVSLRSLEHADRFTRLTGVSDSVYPTNTNPPLEPRLILLPEPPIRELQSFRRICVSIGTEK